MSGLLSAFAVELTAADMESFLAGQQFRIGKPPWVIGAIDFIGHPTGIEFEASYAAREVTELEGVAIPFLSRKHFIQNKMAIGRKTLPMWTICAG